MGNGQSKEAPIRPLNKLSKPISNNSVQAIPSTKSQSPARTPSHSRRGSLANNVAFSDKRFTIMEGGDVDAGLPDPEPQVTPIRKKRMSVFKKGTFKKSNKQQPGVQEVESAAANPTNKWYKRSTSNTPVPMKTLPERYVPPSLIADLLLSILVGHKRPHEIHSNTSRMPTIIDYHSWSR